MSKALDLLRKGGLGIPKDAPQELQRLNSDLQALATETASKLEAVAESLAGSVEKKKARLAILEGHTPRWEELMGRAKALGDRLVERTVEGTKQRANDARSKRPHVADMIDCEMAVQAARDLAASQMNEAELLATAEVDRHTALALAYGPNRVSKDGKLLSEFLVDAHDAGIEEHLSTFRKAIHTRDRVAETTAKAFASFDGACHSGTVELDHGEGLVRRAFAKA